MTVKPAKTVERKRRKYIPYNEQPQKELNIEQFQNMSGIEEPDFQDVTTKDFATLIRVIAQKDEVIEAQRRELNNRSNLITMLYDDVSYLRGELSNPNLFIAQ